MRLVYQPPELTAKVWRNFFLRKSKRTFLKSCRYDNSFGKSLLGGKCKVLNTTHK